MISGRLHILLVTCFLLCCGQSALAVCPSPTADFKMPPEIPMSVTVAFYVLDIERIYTVDHAFIVDVVTGFRWHDPRLAAPAGGQCVYSLSQVWHPDIQLLNRRDISKQLSEEVLVDDQGNTRLRQRYHGTLSADFDLRTFPFDQQVLPIQFVSFAYGPDDLEVAFDVGRTGRSKTFSAFSWEIGTGEPKITVKTINSSHLPAKSEEFIMLEYNFPAERKLNFYFWKVVVPLSIIVFMSWAVFWMKPTQVAVQVTVGATAILTLVAFLFTTSALLPAVSYLTYLDYFVYSALILVFLAFIEALTTCELSAHGYVKMAQSVDQYCRIIFPLLFSINIAIFICLALK